MDQYARRLKAAEDELAQAGIWGMNANPPYTRMLRTVGLRPRPPHYVPFWKVVISQGILFGVLWGLFMWLINWSAQGMPPVAALFAAFLAGALFGLCMALYYRHGRNSYGLSAWETL